jgi:hypothetical protein
MQVFYVINSSIIIIKHKKQSTKKEPKRNKPQGSSHFKGGGCLLSRIALQYHRRKRA